MFNFNFNNKEEEPFQIEPSRENIQWYRSREIKICTDLSFVGNTPKNMLDYGDGLQFTCLSPKEVINILKEKNGDENYRDVLEADGKHSDLLIGKYEGGIKTWECTKDLAVYLKKNVIDKCGATLEGKSVLDLGCGTGILGIFCLQQGAFVTFQDYNKEVLEIMTIPNVVLNYKEQCLENKTCFYSGDWASFLNLINEGKENNKVKTEFSEFDYILTSETIYNPDNYMKLIEIFKKLLKEGGTIFLAAKTHYFGVGGSIYEFEKQLKKSGFSCCKVWKTGNGISREILEIKASSQ